MQLVKAYVESVRINEGRRGASPERVKALAESMKALGLQQPITVWFDENDVGYLVAGRHRLEAARLLGWEEIDAIDVKMSPIEREMWEISENLHRVDLTKDERDKQIRRYAELLEQQDFQSTQNAPIESKRVDGRGHRPKGTAAKIADETGLSKDTIKRALKSPPDPDVAKAAKKTADALKAEKERAQIELWNWLLDTLKPDEWSHLIDLMDAAGGTLKSADLVKWQSP